MYVGLRHLRCCHWWFHASWYNFYKNDQQDATV